MSAGLPVLVLLLACGGERRPEAQALERYREGRELLERGLPAQAAEAFAEATEADPAHLVLRSWQAYALAASGDPQAAVQLLEGGVGVIALTPQDHYNLAAWHARLGQDERAVELLRQALEDDPELRAVVAGDPDLEALRGTSTFGRLLHDVELRAVMVGEEGSILAGESYDLELVVQGKMDAVALSWDRPPPAGFALTKVVDDLQLNESGEPRLRSFRYSLVAAASGEGLLGPWTLSAGGDSVSLATVPWQTVLPPGVELESPGSATSLDERWWMAREALDGLASPSVENRFGRLVVAHSPGDLVAVASEAVSGAPLELEIREDDQAILLAKVWAWAPDV